MFDFTGGVTVETNVDINIIKEVVEEVVIIPGGRVEWLYEGTATSAKASVGLCGTLEVVVAFESEIKKIMMDVIYTSTHARGPKSYNKSYQLEWSMDDGKVAGLNGLDWHGKLEGGVGGNFIIRDRMNLLIELKGIRV